jgi:predicted ATP-dependent endonuclease of OLD family
MYISKIKLYNFKGSKGDHELNFEIGVNFFVFVGDNNYGKSSVLETIDFIRAKKAKEDIITKTSKTEINANVSFEIEFALADLDASFKDLRKQYKVEPHFMMGNLILDVNSYPGYLLPMRFE